MSALPETPVDESVERAEEFTQALELVLEGNAMSLSGAWRLRADGVQRGVPKALGLTINEWCDRLGARLHEWRIQGNRKDIVAEMAAEEMSNREIAAVLGVDEGTIRNDKRAAEDSAVASDEAAPDGEIDGSPAEDSAPTLALVPEPEDDEPEVDPEDAEVVEDDPPAEDPMAVHYSSKTDEWATPQDFYDVVNAEFGFDLDVCALDTSAKCERYFTPETDGLAQDWTGTVWMNPPYGDVIGAWVEKAHESAQAGATVVCLVPARTDTAWFHDHCFPGEVRFIKGRLRFGAAEASAPFPSCLVVLGPNVEKAAFDWSWR